jgi:hypothetical protein
MSDHTWASEDDRKKAQEDLCVYGTACVKTEDGVAYHVPLEEIQKPITATDVLNRTKATSHILETAYARLQKSMASPLIERIEDILKQLK